MDNSFAVGIRIGRMLQADAATVGGIDILKAIKTFVIVEVVVIGMKILIAVMRGIVVDINPDIGIVVDMRHQQSMPWEHVVPTGLLTVLKQIIL